MDGQSRARDLLAAGVLSLEEIWLLYISVGTAGMFELEAFIDDIEVLDQIDLILLECALLGAAPP